jgi:hypothetical protein
MESDSGEPGLGSIRVIAWDALLGVVGGLVVAGLLLEALSRVWITWPVATVGDLAAKHLWPLDAYAVVYAVAGGVVGALTPYLRTARRMYAVYGFVGVCVATALVTIARTSASEIDDRVLYVIVCGAFAVAFAIGRRRSLNRTRGASPG